MFFVKSLVEEIGLILMWLNCAEIVEQIDEGTLCNCYAKFVEIHCA